MITITPGDQTPPPFAYKEPYYISVMLGKRASFVEKPFRCFNCGAILFKYYTDVHIVFDGLISDADAHKYGSPIDVMCRRCKIVVRIL